MNSHIWNLHPPNTNLKNDTNIYIFMNKAGTHSIIKQLVNMFPEPCRSLRLGGDGELTVVVVPIIEHHFLLESRFHCLAAHLEEPPEKEEQNILVITVNEHLHF